MLVALVIFINIVSAKTYTSYSDEQTKEIKEK